MSDKHCDSNDQVGCEADGKEDVDTQKGDASRPRFAKRRPNWEPQKLHHDLKLAPFDELKAQTRKPCPVCGRSRCWYCPDCLCSLCPDEQPVLKLPFKIRIITHPEEKRSKSTGLHAKLLCPEYVELIDFDHVEAENLSPASTALLFPSTEAIRPQELSLSGIDTVYIIDRCEAVFWRQRTADFQCGWYAWFTDLAHRCLHAPGITPRIEHTSIFCHLMSTSRNWNCMSDSASVATRHNIL